MTAAILPDAAESGDAESCTLQSTQLIERCDARFSSGTASPSSQMRSLQTFSKQLWAMTKVVKTSTMAASDYLAVPCERLVTGLVTCHRASAAGFNAVSRRGFQAIRIWVFSFCFCGRSLDFCCDDIMVAEYAAEGVEVACTHG